MLRKKLLIWADIMLISLFLTLAFGSAHAIDNGYFELRMTKVFWADQVTPKELEFSAALEGDNIMSVILRSPKKWKILATKFYEYPLIIHEDYKLVNSIRHKYYKIGKPLDMERKFPLGNYTFRIRYYDPEDGKIKIKRLIYSLVGSFPPRPVITYPEHNQTQVELEPLIEWERTPDDTRFICYFVHIGIQRAGTPHWEYVLGVQIEDIDQTYYQVPPGTFQPNTTYKVWVAIEYDGIFESKSGIQFTTIGSP